jgi:transaldolase
MKFFLDTANINQINIFNKYPEIKGFTTNPSLIKKEKINNYLDFCKSLQKAVKKKPVSFEVISDNVKEVYKQAIILSNIGKNVYVKIPVLNSKGQSFIPIIKKLLKENIKLNITAVFSISQIKSLVSIKSKTKHIISIFSGRIADTCRDPIEYVKFAKRKKSKFCQILWASCREVLNIYHAKISGADIITVPSDIFEKYKKFKNYNLKKFSINTSAMFYNDAKKSKFQI